MKIWDISHKIQKMKVYTYLSKLWLNKSCMCVNLETITMHVKPHWNWTSLKFKNIEIKEFSWNLTLKMKKFKEFCWNWTLLKVESKEIQEHFKIKPPWNPNMEKLKNLNCENWIGDCISSYLKKNKGFCNFKKKNVDFFSTPIKNKCGVKIITNILNLLYCPIYLLKE